MGHLVNPIGFRLGFLDSWIWRDFWCVKHLYYSEMLYSTYRIREELHSLLNGGVLWGWGCLYSHFCIYKKQNKFYIYVFLYDGAIEQWIDDHLIEFLSDESENRRFMYFSERHEMVRGAMRTFFNLFVGKMSFIGRSSTRRQCWDFPVDNRMFKTPGRFKRKKFVRKHLKKQKQSMRGINFYLLRKCRRRFQSIRLILVDRLLPNWKRIFLFKVIFGSGFISGLRIHALYGMQEPFYAYLAFFISEGALNKFSLLKTKVIFLGIRNSEVTSFMLTRYIGIKLANRYTLWELVTPLRREMKFLKQLRCGHIIGFKFHFCGRFTRKQRATSTWVVSGALPLNSIHIYIDYSFSEVVLKNSICSIKIWLYREEGFRKFTYRISL